MLDQKFFDEMVSKYPEPTAEMLFDISDEPIGKPGFTNDIMVIEPKMCTEDEIYPTYKMHLDNIQKHFWDILLGKYPTTGVVNPYMYETDEDSVEEFIADHSNKMNLIVTGNSRLSCVTCDLDIFYSKTFPKDRFLIVPAHCFSLYKDGTNFYQQEKYERKALEIKMAYNFSIAQNKPYYVVALK